MRWIAAVATAGLAVAVPATAKDPAAHGARGSVTTITQAGVTTVRVRPPGASRVMAQRRIRGAFAPAAVARDGATVAMSRDGSTIVLQEVVTASATRRFAIMDGALRRPTRFTTLPSNFTVDAIAPDGRWLFLNETGVGDDPLAYAVRAYDVVVGRLLPQPVIEKGGEQMAGEAMARVEHPQEPWAYTLYAGGKAPFVHALHTTKRYSLCIDLPWTGLTTERAARLRLRLDPQDRLRVVTAARPARTLAVINRENGTVRVTAPSPA